MAPKEEVVVVASNATVGMATVQVNRVVEDSERLFEKDTSTDTLPPPKAKATIQDKIKKFNSHFSEVKKHFIERDCELEQIKYALLTGEHVLLKGKTGTAKSKLGRFVFDHIKSSETFSIQLSKFMSEEYLFGAIDINKMRLEGKVEHVTDKSIVDCEFAFIDEVFDGNDALLRSLLEVLNERTFTRHTQKVKARLHTAIMTSNYVREDEVTEAFLDRIMFKSEVSPITGSKNRLSMLKNYSQHGDKGHKLLAEKLKKNGISFSELGDICEHILDGKVEIPDEVLKFYDQVLREYQKQLNSYVSDRRANKMLNIVKASAALNAREKADVTDVQSIRFALVTTNNEQQEEVFKAVYAKLLADQKKYEAICVEMEKIQEKFAPIFVKFNAGLNPSSKAILELNKEAGEFSTFLNIHQFNSSQTGFKDVDSEFQNIKGKVNNIIHAIAHSLNLSGK